YALNGAAAGTESERFRESPSVLALRPGVRGRVPSHYTVRKAPADSPIDSDFFCENTHNEDLFPKPLRQSRFMGCMVYTQTSLARSTPDLPSKSKSLLPKAVHHFELSEDPAQSIEDALPDALPGAADVFHVARYAARYTDRARWAVDVFFVALGPFALTL